MKSTAKVTLSAGVAIILLLGCNQKEFHKESYSAASKPNQVEEVDIPASISTQSASPVNGAVTTASGTFNGTVGSSANSPSSGLISNSTTTPMTAISSSAAIETGKDSTHKFIRTADMKFKVKSVVNTTYDIEDIIRHFNGFVIYTNLISNIDANTNVAVSADSTLETIYYTVSNYMQIRVPNTNLDSTLKAIAPLIDYLDFRIIKANDIALQLLSNQLSQNRLLKHEQRLTNTIDTRGKKLTETTDAENDLLSKQEQADNTKISSLTIMDQVKFSTITLNIYQRQTIKREMILNDKNVAAYQPGFFAQILNAFKFGWQMLEAILVAVTNLWGIALLAVIGFIIFKIMRQRFQKK